MKGKTIKTIQIFEPAMCCSTGLCGVSVDPELLRISTVVNTLKQQNITIDRFNLSSAPMEFVSNKAVNDFINGQGTDGLPVMLLDGQIALSGRYPTNEELTQWLDLPEGLLDSKRVLKKTKVCGCKGRCC